MDLDHERLDAYHLALDFLVLGSEIIEGLPRGRSHLSDQFSRASLSIVLNLAEGAGKHSKPDKLPPSGHGHGHGHGHVYGWPRNAGTSPSLQPKKNCSPPSPTGGKLRGQA